MELWTRLVEGDFPDYHQILHCSPQHARMTVPPAALLSTLKACLACATREQLGVSLTRLPTGVRVRLEDTAHGHVERLIECSGWAPSQYVGFNARYLLQAVECVRSPTVTMFIKDHTTLVFLQDGQFEAVIMPLRLTAPPDCLQATGAQHCASQETRAQQYS